MEKWVVPDGELFLMGDHRKRSADSREFGTVGVDKVIGRAWLRYWPINTLSILPTPTMRSSSRRSLAGSRRCRRRRREPRSRGPGLRRRGGGGRRGLGSRGPGGAARAPGRAPGGVTRSPIRCRGRLPIAARLASAFLACRLIAIAIRDLDEPTSGSRLGWPVEALAAAAAAVIGFGTHGLGAPGEGPAEAQAAGFAVGVLAASPIVSSRDVFRLGIGAILLLVGGLLVREGLGGTPSELEQLVTSGLVVGLGGAVGVIIAGARSAVGTSWSGIGRRAASSHVKAGTCDRDDPPVPRHLVRCRSRIAPAAPNVGRCRRRSGSPASALPRSRRERSRPDEGVPIGGAELVGSAYLRLFVLFGSIVALLLAILGLATTSHRYAPGVLLGGIGAAGLALALPDARIAVIAATAGGLLGILVTIVPPATARGVVVAGRELRALAIAGCAGDPRRGLDRAAARGAGGGAGGVRPGLPRVRHRGRDPVRCDPVPLLGGPSRRCRPGGHAADAHGLEPGGLRGRRPRLGRSIGGAAGPAAGRRAIAHRRRRRRERRSSARWPPGSRTTSSMSSATRSSPTQASRSWASRRSIRPPGSPPGRGSSSSSWSAARSPPGRSPFAARSGRGGSPQLRGWVLRAPVLAISFGLIVVAAVGWPGLVAWEARATLIDLTLDGPFAGPGHGRRARCSSWSSGGCCTSG